MNGRITLEKLAMPALILGLIGTLYCLAMMVIGDDSSRQAMMQSYIFGYTFWITLSLGCFGMMVLYHLLRAKWVLPVLHILEVAGGAPMLLVMGVLLLPIVIPAVQGHPILYAWVDAHTRASDLVLAHKANYLNPGSFGVRYIIYFASWAGIAFWFKNSTRKQEKTGDIQQETKRNNFSGPAFIWFVLTVTFAFTDWIMSLDDHWSSTMYGLWTGVSMCLGGFAFAVMVFCLNAKKEPYKNVINEKLTRDMGNILFVLTMLWAYTSFSQYLILWSGNLPDTNFYYVERSNGFWNLVGFLTMVGQFFLPFIMLLTPRNKRIPGNLARVCLFMLLIHILDIYQYVMPALRKGGPTPHALDFVTFFSVGLLWLGLCGTLLRREQLLPTFDNRLVQGGQGAH